jgi:hypothetical protein
MLQAQILSAPRARPDRGRGRRAGHLSFRAATVETSSASAQHVPPAAVVTLEQNCSTQASSMRRMR